MLHALRGCNLTCSCTCNNRIGYIVAAQRAVAARSEGLVEAQQLRAELLRISARLNATSSPSMAASVEAASAALAVAISAVKFAALLDISFDNSTFNVLMVDVKLVFKLSKFFSSFTPSMIFPFFFFFTKVFLL